jgi:hypothetical protein
MASIFTKTMNEETNVVCFSVLSSIRLEELKKKKMKTPIFDSRLPGSNSNTAPVKHQTDMITDM